MTKTDIALIVVCAGVVLALGAFLPRESGQNPEPVEVYEEAIEAATDFYTIEARFPVDPRDSKGSMREYVEYHVNSTREEWADVRSPQMYELGIGYDTHESQKLGTVTYVFSEYRFTGGAHGSTVLTTFTFNDRGQVTLDDILNFENGNDIELTRELARKLQGVLGDQSNVNTIYDGLGLSYLRPDGTFDNEKCGCDGFFFPSNFQTAIVGDEGMTFVMGQYQVASYAAGMPEVSFTWAELRPYIRPTFDLPLD